MGPIAKKTIKIYDYNRFFLRLIKPKHANDVREVIKTAESKYEHLDFFICHGGPEDRTELLLKKRFFRSKMALRRGLGRIVTLPIIE
jgi:hypothetical protein